MSSRASLLTELLESLPEYKVRILVKATNTPINSQFYNELGAKIWISRLARQHGLAETDLIISEPFAVQHVYI